MPLTLLIIKTTLILAKHNPILAKHEEQTAEKSERESINLTNFSALPYNPAGDALGLQPMMGTSYAKHSGGAIVNLGL